MCHVGRFVCGHAHICVCVRWSERTGVCVLDAYRDFISIMVGAAALVPPRCLCQHVREPGRVPQRHVSLSTHTNVQRTRCGGMFQRRYRTSVDGIHVNIQQLCLCALRAFWTSYMQVRVPEINYFLESSECKSQWELSVLPCSFWVAYNLQLAYVRGRTWHGRPIEHGRSSSVVLSLGFSCGACSQVHRTITHASLTPQRQSVASMATDVRIRW